MWYTILFWNQMKDKTPVSVSIRNWKSQHWNTVRFSAVGIVRLTIHEAKDFNRKSHSGRFNLFAKVSLGYNDPPIHCTQRFKDGANPIWESTHEFLCPDKNSSIITVKVVNDNCKDPIVGYLSICLDDLLDAKEWGSHWWPLSGCNTGMLMMSADWKSLNMRINWRVR